jgi:fructosamine-3-kinase
MAQLPDSLKREAESLLNSRIMSFRPAAGGCISNGGELITLNKSYFLKWNETTRYPGMFKAEASGLQLLAAHSTLRVPEVIGVVKQADAQAIVLEFIRSAKRAHDFWERLAEGLAALHRNTSGTFGLNHDNYIGSLKQVNQPDQSWINFFIEQRLEIQLALARERGRADDILLKQFQSLYRKLPEMLPNEPPALLHGDLWIGNVMTDERGNPCLIDPAVYYGHREAELAFTQLFGGFDQVFYQAYHHAFPLQPGFEARAAIYNLYPLLVHANLFGGGYILQVKQLIKPLVR